jgi:hypothetical protein
MELSLKNCVEKIEHYVQNGGPEESEWDELNNLINKIHSNVVHQKFNETDLHKIIDAFGDSLTVETIHGQMYLKPYGYSGDYDIIDKIHTNFINENYKLFNNYSINLCGAQAVRNRKNYLNNSIVSITNSHQLNILNIASGPCRDIKEFYDGNKDAKIHFDCVEFDPKAIDYAISVLDGYSKNVNFINKNALRFTTDKKYDLVWSGGLFDYFDDNIFVRLLKRYSTFLKENAELVIGNFSPNNPSKAYMELMNWKLNYRDKNHLLQLAEQAGLDMNNVFVDSEPLGINLFLHYRNQI